MQIPKPSEGGSYTPAPAGTHTAVCISFIDLGTQNSEYMGEKKLRHEIAIIWELADENMDDGRPFTVSKVYTWSMNEKATLRKHLEAWRTKAFVDADFEGPNAFNTKNLLGKSCTLTIVSQTKDGKTYSKIDGVGPKMKGLADKTPVNQMTYISLSGDDFNPEAIGQLSNYWREKIGASPEYQAHMMSDQNSHPPMIEGGFNDDVPF